MASVKKCLSISNQDEGMYGIFIHSLNGYNTLQIKTIQTFDGFRLTKNDEN